MNKLNNLPIILWINLDKHVNRYDYMLNLFNKYKLNHIRISGLDGKKYENFCKINKFKKKINFGEIGCFASHIKTLEYFVNNIKSDYCLVMEDDISFEYLQYWEKDFWVI
jgi:glycosyl transferase family 25